MSLSQPSNNGIPFGQSSLKNTIPATTATFGAASFTGGFPNETLLPPTSGGIAPDGKDVNGILNQLSQHQVWTNAGGQYKYDLTLATTVGGYALYAVVQADDGSKSYINMLAGNTSNPNTGGSNWLVWVDKSLRSDLQALGGSSLVGFVQAGSDAIATTVQSKARERYSVYDVMTAAQIADTRLPTPTLDQTIPMSKAIAYAAANNLELIFPAGTYLINPLRLSASFPAGSTYAFDLVSNIQIRGEGRVIFRIKDNSSTDASPKRFNMFYASTFAQNISFDNIIFDGNGANNPISPNRGTNVYNNWNQSFIAFFGNSASGQGIRIRRCTFTGNPGVSNIICGVPNGVAVSPMGSDWEISQTLHYDNGMDSTDHSSIFGYARNVRCINNVFYQTVAPTAYNGVGARNAFEVHGSYAVVENNYIENYFGGMIINSNWVEPVVKCSVSNNKMKNMFYYGIYIWRQPSSPLNQSIIQDIDIKDNQIELSNTLYSTPTTTKGGVIGVSNFLLSISGMTIAGNTVTAQSGMTNASALVFLQTQAVGSTELMDNFHVLNNRCEGTYHGIIFQSTASNAAKFGTLIIKGNTIRNLVNAGPNVTTQAISCVGTAGINTCIIEDNAIIDTNLSQTKFGVTLSGPIGVLSLRNNLMQNVTTPLSDSSTVALRMGEDMRIAQPTGTGVTTTGWRQLTRKTYTVTINYLAWQTFAALSGSVTALFIPSRTRLVSIIADTTIAYAGTGLTTATLQLGITGDTASAIAVHSVTAATTKGLLDADLGTAMTRAAAIQGGQMFSWTAGTSLRALLTGDVNLTNLTAGSTTFHITLEGMF